MFLGKLKNHSSKFNKTWFVRFCIVGTVVAIAISSGELMIFGGAPVTSNRFDFVFELSLKKRIEGSWVDSLCSGSLVHPKLILTAAHCLNGNTSVHYAQNGNNTKKRRQRGIKVFPQDWNFHPQYKNKTDRKWDVGYVVLTDAVTDIKPVSIAPIQFEDNPKKITVVGFGRTEFHNESSTSIKNRVKLDVAQIQYPDYILVNNDGAGVLFGDSGGPVLVKGDDTPFEQIAVTHGFQGDENTGEYAYSIYTLLNKENLCWVEQDSKIDIPNVNCSF